MRKYAPLLVCFAFAGCGKPDVTGEWELVDAKTGQALGDVATLNAGGTWHRTGFPAMAGTYEWVDGKLAFKINEVAGVDRTVATDAGKGFVDVEGRLAQVEKQMVFEVVTEGGTMTMKQANPIKGLAELRFRKKTN